MERNYTQIQLNKEISLRNRKKLNKQLINGIGAFVVVILFVVANIYNNRWGRNITKLDHQIQKLENTLEKERKINQEYESKEIVAKQKNNSFKMKYGSNNVIVVQKFSK